MVSWTIQWMLQYRLKVSQSFLETSFSKLDSSKFQGPRLKLNCEMFKAFWEIMEISRNFWDRLQDFWVLKKGFSCDYFFTFESEHKLLITVNFLIFNTVGYCVFKVFTYLGCVQLTLFWNKNKQNGLQIFLWSEMQDNFSTTFCRETMLQMFFVLQ